MPTRVTSRFPSRNSDRSSSNSRSRPTKVVKDIGRSPVTSTSCGLSTREPGPGSCAFPMPTIMAREAGAWIVPCPPDQRPADLGPFPVRADDRHDLLVDEPPDGDEVLPLLVGELLADGEEVRPEGFPEVRVRHLCHRWLPCAVRSASRNASTAAARRSESAASSRWPPL